MQILSPYIYLLYKHLISIQCFYLKFRSLWFTYFALLVFTKLLMTINAIYYIKCFKES